MFTVLSTWERANERPLDEDLKKEYFLSEITPIVNKTMKHSEEIVVGFESSSFKRSREVILNQMFDVIDYMMAYVGNCDIEE